jgi:Secretion system C-terminal sorting domain
MKRNQIIPLIFIFVLFTINSSAQDNSITGVSGGSVTPLRVSVSEMLMFVGPYTGPIKERPEGEPPYAPPQPAPISSSINNVTLDKGVNNNQVLAPTLGTNFEGITQGAYIPSEPSAAGGPLNIFSTGNVSVTITNKDGSNRTEINGNTFFGAPTSEGAISDAVCCYDAVRGSFVALCFTQGSNPRHSNYYLMISQTNDARGSWWQYKFDWRVDGATTTTNWGDFEEFGFSGDKFVISSQQFSFGGNSYKYQKLRVMDITKIYSGQTVTWVDFVKFAAPPGGDISNLFVTKPGRNIYSGDNTIHLFTTRYNGGTNIAYRYITGTPSSPSLSAGTLITVNSYGAAVKAKGGSNTATVVCNDCRTTNFVVRNGYLHIAWHFGINFGSGTVDAIRYVKLNVTTPSSPVKVTDETFGADGIYYYYPDCTADQYGNMFIGFGRSSQTEFPSSYVSGKRTTDATIEASALAKAGTAVTSQSRWGDFTGIDMDETGSSSTQSVAWYAGQWTKGSNTFGTWLSQLTFTTPTASSKINIENSNSNSLKPGEFSVRQNYPNPSNPSSIIEYQLPVDAKVSIRVYDMLGNEVAALVDREQTAGNYTAEFNGSAYSSGVYFYKITAVGAGLEFSKTLRMVIVK